MSVILKPGSIELIYTFHDKPEKLKELCEWVIDDHRNSPSFELDDNIILHLLPGAKQDELLFYMDFRRRPIGLPVNIRFFRRRGVTTTYKKLVEVFSRIPSEDYIYQSLDLGVIQWNNEVLCIRIWNPI